MGIDIYAKWPGQTVEEEEAQYTGFSTHHGHVGYLREAYHGGPYATRVLVPEAFGIDEGQEPAIPASTLRKRLPEAMQAVIQRAREVYNEEITESDAAVKSFADFVELCERKEEETGKPCTIIASY